MAITPLPQAPNRNMDVEEFSDVADAWVAALSLWTTQANDTEENMDELAASAAASAAAASVSAATASTAASVAESLSHFKGDWSSLSGGLNIPASARYGGHIWILKENVADVAAEVPGVSTKWFYHNGSFPVIYTDIAGVSNLLYYSDSLSGSGWTTTRLYNQTNYVPGPLNGGSTMVGLASRLMDTTANDTHYVEQSITNAPLSAPHTATVYLKAATLTKATLQVGNGANNIVYAECQFDLSAGTAGAVTTTGGTVGSASIDNIGSGWYRCRVTATVGAGTGSVRFRLLLANAAGATSYAGTGNGDVLAFGAQLERASTPAIYMKSTDEYGVVLAPYAIMSDVHYVIRNLPNTIGPQELIADSNPPDGAFVIIQIGNGLTTNVFNPNGKSVQGYLEPLILDVMRVYFLRYTNGTWNLL
jgi:hypothetical protein